MPVQNVNSLLSDNILIDETYELIRSDVFHYLQITDEQRDIFSSSSKLESIPNIAFYTENSETKAILDFSNASEKDKNYLDLLFSNMTYLNGISLTNAVYLDEKNGISNKSLTSSLLFREYKNNILIAKALNTIDSGDLNKVFFGSYFIDIPVITTDTNWSDKTTKINSCIININPKSKTNFDSFYLKSGDLVEIVNSESLNNQQSSEIDSVTTLNNKQIIKLKNKIKNESLIGKNTILNFYTKTKLKNVKQYTLDKTTTGCCENIRTKETYKPATEYECNLRTNGYYIFTKGNSCLSSGSNVPGVVVPKITLNTRAVQLTRSDLVFYEMPDLIELQISIKNNKFYINGNNLSVFSLQSGKTYKFIQTDESNAGYPLRLTLSDSTIVQENSSFPAYYQENTFGIAFPEGIGSELYLKVTNTTAPLLYMFTEKNKRISSPMLILVSS